MAPLYFTIDHRLKIKIVRGTVVEYGGRRNGETKSPPEISLRSYWMGLVLGAYLVYNER